MIATAGALTWQLWRRGRPGLIGATGSMLTAGLLLDRLSPAARSRAIGPVVFGAVLVFCYLVSILTYSNDAGTGRNQTSRFPRRMFHLPVSTHVLVAVPMVLGIVVCAGAWAGLRALVFRPLGHDVPFILPALGLAAAMSLFQVLAWWPSGHSAVRVLLATGLGTSAVLLAVWADLVGTAPFSRPWLPLVVGVLLAYPLAVVGVSVDRSGGSSQRSTASVRALPIAFRSMRDPGGGSFTSAAQALSWFEFRAKGIGFATLLVGLHILITAFHAMLAALVPAGQGLGGTTLFAFATTVPLWGAVALGPNLAKPSLWEPGLALSVFAAVRPVSTGSLYLAMLHSLARSLLIVWGIVVVVTAARVAFIGLPAPIALWWASLEATHGPMGSGAIVAGLTVSCVILSCWLAAGAMVAGLSGRPKVLAGVTVAKSIVLGLIVWQASRIVSRLDDRAEALTLITVVLVIAVGVKLATAALVMRASIRRKWCTPSAAAALVVGWVATAAFVASVGSWAWPSKPTEVSWITLVLAVAVSLPLAQLSLGPAMLAWNRHR